MGPMTAATPMKEAVLQKVTQELERIFADAGASEVIVERQQRLSISSFFNSRLTDNPDSGVATADIILYFSPNHPIPELEHIDTLDRWFPESQIQVPIAAIEVKTRRSVLGVKQDYLNMLTVAGRHEQLNGFDFPFKNGKILLLDDEESDSESPPTDDNVAVIQHVDELEESPLVQSLIGLAEECDEQSRAGEVSYEDFVDSFDPEVFHFNEVLSAYRNERTQNLVILLSVFFEGYVKDLRTSTMKEVQQNPAAGKFYSEWDFKDSLDACRFFGSLEESDYDVINQIRDERNSYAHNIKAYHGGSQGSAITEDTLEKAIRLYEELIGVKKSMLDDS